MTSESRKTYLREWYKANKKRIKGVSKKWRTANKEYIKGKRDSKEGQRYQRDYWLERAYGVDQWWYDNKLREQDYRCAICQTDKPEGRWKRFVVDHDHETGQVRGLLCNACNWKLGKIEQFGEAVSEYLCDFKCFDPTLFPGSGPCLSRQAERALSRKYGVTGEWYEAQSKAQSDSCAVCKGRDHKRLAVDHNHASGRVRGLLCKNCNIRVGFFEDEVFRVAATKYLKLF